MERQKKMERNSVKRRKKYEKMKVPEQSKKRKECLEVSWMYLLQQHIPSAQVQRMFR